MKYIALILSLVFVLVGSGIRLDEQNVSCILPDIKVIPGKHCESSAIVNALNYQNYGISESTVFGGGGALSFVFTEDQFPFLGGRSVDMQEIFFSGAGIKWHLKRPENGSNSWTDLLILLKRGIPVVLRVDMRYLPYLFGGKYGPPYMSFGWHMICLFGIDTQKKMAYVSDTEHKELKEIKLEDLKKARFAKSLLFPPEGEYYWIEKKSVDYRLDWKRLTLKAIEQVVKNMALSRFPPESGMNGLVGLEGLKNLEGKLRDLENTVKNPLMIPILLKFWYGCIETNGTGGASFRILFRDFIKEAEDKVKDIDFSEALKAINKTIDAWHGLANGFRDLSGTIGGVQVKGKREEHYQTLAKLANELYKKEKVMVQVFKSMVSTSD